MATNQVLRDHVAAAILEAATAVLSEHPDASMADVAEAAGVGRATLYRYFLNRDHLVRALVKAALDDAHQRLVEAELGSVTVPEAMARLTRALVASGTKFAMLMNERDHHHVDPEDVRAAVAAPVRAVFQRGIADGSFRPELTPDVLSALYSGLLKAALHMTTTLGIGIERGAALVTETFLCGTSRGLCQPGPGPRAEGAFEVGAGADGGARAAAGAATGGAAAGGAAAGANGRAAAGRSAVAADVDGKAAAGGGAAGVDSSAGGDARHATGPRRRAGVARHRAS